MHLLFPADIIILLAVLSTQGYTITQEGNPNVQWETSTQTDVGLDLGLFQNRFQFTADYYIKNTTNLLFNVPLPSSGGSVTPPSENAGKVRNNGLELQATYNSKGNSKLTYSITGNFAWLHNKVMSLLITVQLPAAELIIIILLRLQLLGSQLVNFIYWKMKEFFKQIKKCLHMLTRALMLNAGDVMFKDISGPDGKA